MLGGAPSEGFRGMFSSLLTLHRFKNCVFIVVGANKFWGGNYDYETGHEFDWVFGVVSVLPLSVSFAAFPHIQCFSGAALIL